jgi:preprotein translocase subunit Sss1
VVPVNVRRDLKPRLDADMLTADAIRPTEAEYDMELISVLIGMLVIAVVGAICFKAIDKFATDR